MITVEDKIRTFSKYVYDKEVRKANKLLAEIDSKNMEITDSKRKEIETKCSLLNEKMSKNIQIKSQKILSTAKIDSKKMLLNVQKDLLNSFISEIISSLIEFTNKEAYDIYVKDTLCESSELILNNDTKIFLVKRDVQRFSSYIKAEYKNVEIVQMDDENIGGIIIESVSDKERMDYTIKRKVNEYKSEIGIRLYESLEKQVK
ncbi:hypothetical protein GC105_02270 [Alkalibaculum sp. M08DMB]|uniref:Uncharacterized protein n=1 Tax=Alkalibaculum sporogenes TaxID=2655001 RepID=A0A6A7K5C8_9FIRM|nr:V-type ATP synthase subunit E [Alkalibaculum sporogenes]MPW24618.1 hypothetical protein [Alkalibaculum sporogenes]